VRLRAQFDVFEELRPQRQAVALQSVPLPVVVPHEPMILERTQEPMRGRAGSFAFPLHSLMNSPVAPPTRSSSPSALRTVCGAISSSSFPHRG
jgi:hypothetical protein